jgi:hypothetical protein
MDFVTTRHINSCTGLHDEQEVLGSTNLPTFPMAMVAIVTLAKDYVM